MIMNRRRAERHYVGWNGFYHLAGESAAGWRDCRVIDVSTNGLGIRLQHFRPAELVNRHISIDLPAVGDSVNLHLEGQIKHVSKTPLRAWVRVGIEFGKLSSTERSILAALGCASDQGLLKLADATAAG